MDKSLVDQRVIGNDRRFLTNGRLQDRLTNHDLGVVAGLLDRPANVRHQVARVSLQEEYVPTRSLDVVHDEIQEVFHQLFEILDVAKRPVGFVQELKCLISL